MAQVAIVAIVAVLVLFFGIRSSGPIPVDFGVSMKANRLENVTIVPKDQKEAFMPLPERNPARLAHGADGAVPAERGLK